MKLPKRPRSIFGHQRLPQQDESDEDDDEDRTSPSYIDKMWRAQQNYAVIQEAKAIRNAGCKKLEDQIAILDNETEMVSLLAFHPFQPILYATDERDNVCIWNWEEGVKLRSFKNRNPAGTRITAIELINDHDLALLLTATDDGLIRVWRNLEQAETTNVDNVSAWRGLTDINRHKRSRGAGVVVDWQQENGILMVSGDSNIIRVWDVEKELSIQEISTNTDACITSLDDDKIGGRVVIAGCGDGKILVFDRRTPNRYSPLHVLNEHQKWVVNAHIPRSENMIISGSVEGDVKFWDIRGTLSTNTISSHNTRMTSLAVHEHAAIIATGSQNQKIKVLNFQGEEISQIRYHDGFLGQRIGPISCLAFHPYKLLLGAGATDSIISIYEASTAL